jgi:hypothetical protein
MERHAKELNGPSADEMLSISDRMSAERFRPAPSATATSAPPDGISAYPTWTPTGLTPAVLPPPAKPARIAAPPAAGWDPVSADDVNGKKRD